MTDILTITAAQDRRRAGRRFRKGQPVEIDMADLEEDEIAALEADPLLTVSLLPPAAGKPEPKSGTGKSGSKSGTRKPGSKKGRAKTKPPAQSNQVPKTGKSEAGSEKPVAEKPAAEVSPAGTDDK